MFLGAEIDDWQRADSRVRPMCDRKPSVNGKFFGEHGGRNFVETRAAIRFGNSSAHQAKLTALLYELRHQTGLFVFQILRERENFLQNKLFGGLPDQLLIVG